jgi:hypothetical protein
MTNELIVAAYDKDLSWTSDISRDTKVIIYRKGDTSCHKEEIILPNNVGRDIHTFFNHIYTNYNNLAPITFFVQDYPFDHWENLVEVINSGLSGCEENSCLNIDNGYFGFHFNTIKVPSDKGGIMWGLYNSTHHGKGLIIRCNKDGSPQAPGWFSAGELDVYWNDLFLSDPPSAYEFVPGGHFAITKDKAHMRSRDFYKRIVDTLESDEEYPWAVERFECYIYNEAYKTKL